MCRAGSSRAERCETGQVRATWPQSPWTVGQPSRMWTLNRLATVCDEQGVSEPPLACPTMVDAIVRLEVSWPRANYWSVSPDPAYERKKTVGTA
jgi:hypothetical protein